MNAIRAELVKLLTTRMWWILAIVLLAYVAFTAIILAAAFSSGVASAGSGMPPGQGAPQLPADALPPIIYSIAHSIGYVFPLLLGTLAVTGEFRHQTLTPTFLATPRRGRVLGAKLVVMAIFGALYGVVAVIAAVGPGAAILSIDDGITGLDDGELWQMFARIVLAMALWAIIGVGVGALIPNQVAAVVVVLAFTQFIEPILRTVAAFVDWAASVGNFLPGAAGDTLAGASIFTALGMSTGESPALEWWQGGLVLLAYALVATVVGYVVSWRRDVT
ncbi:MAG TPA: ABC transporter permease [Homoserinimonas sp.]|nr:ABC transporter permease [Homoserinimonas sp.]